MRRLEYAVPTGVDQPSLGLGITAPEQENQPFPAPVQFIDHPVGKAFPALALVRAGHARLHGQHRVQQQHAAPRPRRQAPMIGTPDAEVVFDFREDILKRGWHRHARPHRKTQAVRLTGAVVRVLPQDHRLDRIERRRVQRRENLRPGRVDALAGVFLAYQERAQRDHFRMIEIIADARLPRRLQLQPLVSHQLLPRTVLRKSKAIADAGGLRAMASADT